MTANEKEQMMIDDILDFMRLAGDIARGAQNHLDASANYLKAESVTSVVTAADLEISQLFRQFVARRFELKIKVAALVFVNDEFPGGYVFYYRVYAGAGGIFGRIYFAGEHCLAVVGFKDGYVLVFVLLFYLPPAGARRRLSL